MIFLKGLPRLSRRKDINWIYPPTRYRTALGILLAESDNRCVYSLVHVKDIGRKILEVDHYNPTLVHPDRNRHGNLVAASRYANGAKGDYWPTAEDLKRGLYIIDPYSEADYGEHIFENANTGELAGTTATGRWHIERLDLNAEHLVLKRLDRTRFIAALKHTAYHTGSDPTGSKYQILLDTLKEFEKSYLAKTIPLLPQCAS